MEFAKNWHGYYLNLLYCSCVLLTKNKFFKMFWCPIPEFKKKTGENRLFLSQLSKSLSSKPNKQNKNQHSSCIIF